MIIGQVLDKFLPITEPWIYSQITGLEKRGINSKIFCHKITNQDSFQHKHIFSYKNLPSWKISAYKLQSLAVKQDAAMLYWNNILKKEESLPTNKRINIIHSHFGWAAQKGIDLAIKNNLPHIATFYGADVTRDPYDPNKRNYQKKLPLIFDYSKLILCPSNFLKKELIKLGAPKNKVIVWRPAISINVPKMNKKNDEIFRIISVGRFIDWKGQKYLIKALLKIIEKHSNIEVNFIGTGNTLDDCKKLTLKLKISKYVNFLGKLPDYSEVLRKMKEADIIVHSSYTADSGVNDALGVVLAEAAMCNTPGIASNCGGMPEIIINNKTGLSVRQRDFKDIAEKTIYCIENKNKLLKFSQNAKKHSEILFNYNNQINKLFNIINLYAKD